MLPPWLRQIKKRFVGHGATIRKHQAALAFEALEDRWVMNVAVWSGGTIASPPFNGSLIFVNTGVTPNTTLHSAKWSDSGNWVNNYVPQPGDDVIFPAGLDAAHKPPAAIVNNTFVWFPNSEVDQDFQINNLTILDDNYRIDSFPGDSFFPASSPTLTITGEIRSLITQPIGQLTGVSMIGDDGLPPGPTNLTIKMTGISQSLRADGTGVLKIAVPIVEPQPGDVFFTPAVQANGVGLVKNGTTTMELSGANSFTGTVTVVQGTLLVTNAFALGDSVRGTTVRNGATLAVTGAAGIQDSLSIVGTGVPRTVAGVLSTGGTGVGALNGDVDPLGIFDAGLPPIFTADTGPSEWAGNINLSASATIGTSGSNITVSGQITGAGDLTKVGARILELTNANAYSGQTLINEGEVDIANNDALSTSPLSSTTVANGAALGIEGNLTVPETLFLNGDGTPARDGNGNPFGALKLITPGALATWAGSITLLSNSSVGVVNSNTLGFSTTILTLTGGLGGAFDLSKVDQGRFTITSSNDGVGGHTLFGGNTFVRNGNLNITNGTALGPVNAKTINTNNANSVQGTLELQGTFTLGKLLDIAGQGFNSLGAIHVVESPLGSNPSNDPLGVPSNVTLTGNLRLSGQTSFRVDPVSFLRQTGVMSSQRTTDSLDKFGLGQFYVGGANTFTSAFNVREGTAVLETATGLGSTASGTQVSAGATLSIPKPLAIAGENLTLSGVGTTSGRGALEVGYSAPAFPGFAGIPGTPGTTTIGGIVVLNGQDSTEADINTNSGTILNFSNVLSGDANLRKLGAGELRLTGTAPNQFVKNTLLDSGTIALGKVVAGGTQPGQALGGSIVVGDGLGGNNADVLRLDAPNQIPDALSLIVTRSGLFNLNNLNETLGGVTAVSLGGGNIATGTGLLTLGGNLTTTGAIDETTGLPKASVIDGKINLGGTTRTFILAATPTTTLGSNRNPSTFGAPLTFTFTATKNPGLSAPSGTVKFFSDGVQIGQIQLLANDPTVLPAGTTSTASVTTTTIGGGSHVITALYSGDGNYPPVLTTLSPNQLVVNPAERILLSTDRNPAGNTDPITFSYVIKGPASTAAPTGTVTFFDTLNGVRTVLTDSNNGMTAQPLDIIGRTSLRVVNLNTGIHIIEAVYSGDANYEPSTVTLAPTLVVGVVPVTTVTTNAEPALRGQSVTYTFRALGAGGGGVPQGSVTFVDTTTTTTALGVTMTTTTTLGTAPINATTGIATLPVPAGFNTVGLHNITAQYSGDAFYTPAIATLAPVQQVINPFDVTLQVNGNPTTGVGGNPAAFNNSLTQNFTLVYAASSRLGQPTPQGRVTFKSQTGPTTFTTLGIADLGSGGNPAGIATFTLAAGPPVGSLNIVASFAPSNGFFLPQDATLSPPEVIQNAALTATTPFTLILSSGRNPSLPGESLNLSVASTRAFGTIQFRIGGSNFGNPVTLNLDPFGNSTLPIQSPARITVPAGVLSVGNFVIDAVFTAQTGSPIGNQTVALPTNQFVVEPITAVLTSNENPALVGDTVTFTFTTVVPKAFPATTFTPATPAGPPVVDTTIDPNTGAFTGPTVTFRDGGTVLGIAPIIGGVATLTVPTMVGGVPLLTGNRNITALFSGDIGTSTAPGFGITTAVYGSFMATLAPRQVVAGGLPSQVTLISSENSGVLGDNITFTYTAAGRTGQLPPTGRVQFFDFDGVNTNPIGVATVLQGGVAQISTNVLTVGVHNITAMYFGDANYVASTASLSPQQRIVNPPFAQLLSSAYVQQSGQPVTFTVSLLRNTLPNVTTPLVTGTVQFFDTFNGVTTQILGDQPVDATNNPATQGTASVTTSALAQGTHVITARYLGDTNYEPMNFTLLPNEVIQATPPPPVSPPATVLPSQQPILQVNAVISGTAPAGFAAPGLIKAGTGLLILNPTANGAAAVDTYTGPTIQNGGNGTIRLDRDNALPATDLIINAGTVDINGHVQTVASLSGLTGGVINLPGGVLAVGTSGASTSYAGSVQGTGTLVKVGAGTLSLGGNSPGFTGTTNVNAGTVLVNGDYSPATTNVASGATLGGTGAAGVVNVAPGGTVSPGNPIPPSTTPVGTLTAFTTTFNGGVLAIDLSKVGAVLTSDKLATNSLLVGTANPVLLLNAAAYANPLAADAAFTVLTSVTALPAGFRFNRPDGTTIANGGTLVANGRVFTITYGATSVTAQFMGLQTLGTLIAAANPVSPGQQVTLTATFGAGAPGDPFPQGTVTFSDPDPTTTFAPITVPLLAGSNGVATTVATFTTIGTHAITATFSASTNGYLNATATLNEVVNLTTTTVLATSDRSTVFGDPVTLTAVVTGGAVTPTGFVNFVNASTGAFLGTAALDGSGVARLTTTGLQAGRFILQAAYTGDSQYRASVGAVAQVVTAKPLVAAGAAAGGTGTVAVYNGQTGALVRQSAPFGAYAGGVKVATGDVNGDGYADLILMGGPGAQLGHVQIQSGRPSDAFSLLADYRLTSFFGELNLAAGDVNGDGRADVVVSTATKFDYVAVFDGATQNRIAAYSVFGGLSLGVTLAVGDFDGDGKADVIAGTGKRAAVLGGQGAAVVVNGLTGARLASPGFAGAFLMPLQTNGVSVAAADVNGDGLADVVLGTLSPTPGIGSVIAVYDAATKGLVSGTGFLPYPGAPVGVRLSSVDRNGDGRDEIITTFTGGVPLGAYYTFNPATNSFTVLDAFVVSGIKAPTGGLNVGGSR